MSNEDNNGAKSEKSPNLHSLLKVFYIQLISTTPVFLGALLMGVYAHYVRIPPVGFIVSHPELTIPLITVLFIFIGYVSVLFLILSELRKSSHISCHILKRKNSKYNKSFLKLNILETRLWMLPGFAGLFGVFAILAIYMNVNSLSVTIISLTSIGFLLLGWPFGFSMRIIRRKVLPKISDYILANTIVFTFQLILIIIAFKTYRPDLYGWTEYLAKTIGAHLTAIIYHTLFVFGGLFTSFIALAGVILNIKVRSLIFIFLTVFFLIFIAPGLRTLLVFVVGLSGIGGLLKVSVPLEKNYVCSHNLASLIAEEVDCSTIENKVLWTKKMCLVNTEGQFVRVVRPDDLQSVISGDATFTYFGNSDKDGDPAKAKAKPVVEYSDLKFAQDFKVTILENGFCSTESQQ